MKILVTLLALILIFPTLSSAHPPTDIKLEYNAETQSLSVGMTHVSHNLNQHRIRRIVVSVNGKEVEGFTFASQTSKERQEANLAVAAKKGDVISIKAYCSKGGIGEAEYTVE